MTPEQREGLKAIREALETSMTPRRIECDGPGCMGCWKDDVRTALAILDTIEGEGAEPAMPTYDAGLLNDFGGGNVDWWQDYIRAELNRADDFYQSWYQSRQPSTPQPAKEGAEPVAWMGDNVQPITATLRNTYEHAEHPILVHYDIPLYTTPQPAPLLTDKEIERIAWKCYPHIRAQDAGRKADMATKRSAGIELLRYARDNGYLAPAPQVDIERMVNASRAVVERWHSPAWKYADPHTGDLIRDLETATNALTPKP